MFCRKMKHWCIDNWLKTEFLFPHFIADVGVTTSNVSILPTNNWSKTKTTIKGWFG